MQMRMIDYQRSLNLEVNSCSLKSALPQNTVPPKSPILFNYGYNQTKLFVAFF
ncbi:hypothetical protein [Peribacillus asahii]|uniref:hypothetical protein n=1 Tax=Peribacillus asahii TaxID=228899 RepID=UPI00207924AB|nr:hypothetical protein [Peribacillus asahii]USK72268.1 hypothetical protein LIS76_11200 [Peribacillus asahii]